MSEFKTRKVSQVPSIERSGGTSKYDPIIEDAKALTSEDDAIEVEFEDSKVASMRASVLRQVIRDRGESLIVQQRGSSLYVSPGDPSPRKRTAKKATARKPAAKKATKKTARKAKAKVVDLSE